MPKNKDMFFSRYDKILDGWRIAVPREWARVFRAGGGVATFALGEGRLALTTRELAESATDGKDWLRKDPNVAMEAID